MFKRPTIVLASAAIVIAPFLPGVAAGNVAEWSELPTSQTWEYTDYQVDELDSTSNTLMKFGDTLVRVDRAASCSGSCSLRDLHILTSGGAVTVADVPWSALDEQLVAKSDGRLVYAEFVENSANHINVIEIDLATGMESVLLEDTLIPNTTNIEVTVDGEMIYFQVDVDHSKANELFPQTGVYVYNPRYDQIEMLYVQYELQLEELMDVEDGQAIVKMTFPTGEEQLWVYDYVEFGEQSAHAIPGTWTVDVEDIVAAHFTVNGSIEFFRQYARNKTNATFTETTAYEEYLDWYRSYDVEDLRNIVQVNGDHMAWIDPENDLWGSNGASSVELGNIGAQGTFRLLEDGQVIWGNGSTGGLMTTSGSVLANFDFSATDMLDDVVVGANSDGEVVYFNTTSGAEMTIGFGGTPLLADSRHVYWKGSDAKIYQATIYLSAAFEAEGEPVKTADSAEVYLMTENTIAYIPSEAVYYTWFASFAEVETVALSEIESKVTLTEVEMKPGTLLRIDGASKVYVVGADGELHWVVTSTIIKDLYGKSWSGLVKKVSSAEVIDMPYGSVISTAEEMSNIVLSE